MSETRLTTKVVPPLGSLDSLIYWFGEAPGREENIHVEPFRGDSGQFLTRVMAKKRIIRSDQVLHNIFSQQPPYNKIGYYYTDKNNTKLTWEGREHVERLRIWLEKILERRERTGKEPNLLVALGKPAMLHLTGKKRIYKWRGTVLPCTLVPGFKVYPTLHPSHVMRTMQEEGVKLVGQKKEMAMNALPLFEIDMDRIMVQSESPTFTPPKRHFEIDLSFLETIQRLNTVLHSKIPYVSVDIETLQGQEGPLVWKVGFSPQPDYAFSIPFISKGQFHWALEEEIHIWRKISEIFLHPTMLKIFQGGGYDLAVLGRYYGLRVAKGTWADTMHCHHASYPYLWKRLEIQTSIYTWEPYYKDEGRVSVGSRTDEAEGKYNCKDCAVTREIYPITIENAKELKTWEGYKRTMSILPSHLGMTLRGVRIDQEGKIKLSSEFKIMAAKAKTVVTDAIGQDINLNSYDQKNRLLYGYFGLEIQLKRGTKKPTTDKNALNKLKRKYRGKPEGKIVEAIMDYAKFAKLASTYTDMRLDTDGRIRTSYNLVSTWRMNSSASPFGGWTKVDREGGNLQNIPVRTEEGRMVRRLFIADPGMRLLCSDRDTAEAMVVAWDAQDRTRMKMFMEGYDVHWHNAKLIFGIPNEMTYNPKAIWTNPITGEPHLLKVYRDVGKTVIFAMYYGMGPHKLMEILAVEGFIIEFKESKALLTVAKARNPLVQQWQRDIREEVRSTRTLISPIGRKREFMGRFNANLYNAAYAFKPQNTVGELTEITIQRIWERLNKNYQVLMNIHDEVIGQCYPKHINQNIRDIRELSSYPIMIKGKELDIPVSFKTGDNWADTEEIEI